MKRNYIIFFVILVCVALISRIWIVKEPEKAIKIGVVGPFSGNSAVFGNFMQNGLKLALAELSPEDRANIEIIKEDDACAAKSAVSAVRKLIEVDHVSYVIGPLCNEASIATEKIFEDSRVVSLAIGLPSTAIANMGPYHFSFSPEIEYLMKTISGEILGRNLRRVAVIHVVSTFEDENYRHFVESFTEMGGMIVSDQAGVKGSADFKDAVLKIKDSKPDAIMIIAVTSDLNNILKQLEIQNMSSLPKFSIHAAETPVLSQVKDAADGLIYPYPADRVEIESARKFSELYKATYNADSNPYSANTYDSFKILVSAIHECGYANRECVQSELAHLKDYRGANGNLSVDDRGVGVYKEIMIKVFEKGEFKTISK